MSESAPAPAARAAETLWRAWSAGELLDGLPSDQQPSDMGGAYAIQSELDRFAGSRLGWKLAATGAGGRAALGVEQPLAGPLYELFALAPGAELEFGAIRMKTVEAEFGLILGADLPADQAPFDRAAVLSALRAFVPAIEIPNTRYRDHRSAGATLLTADAALAGFFVLGEPLADFEPEALPQHLLTLTTAAGTAEGTGAKVLGDPVEAVRWLANELASHGRGLTAGECVITGAAAAMREPGAGHVHADFGALGSLDLTLA
jgi:2-keto-4-pentenoate hydratase